MPAAMAAAPVTRASRRPPGASFSSST
jgi:hypothetical protein